MYKFLSVYTTHLISLEYREITRYIYIYASLFFKAEDNPELEAARPMDPAEPSYPVREVGAPPRDSREE